MTPVLIEQPLRPSEASALAELIFQVAEGKVLNEDLRTRLHSRIGNLNLESIVPYTGSLAKDPTHVSAYYIAVDGVHHGKTTQLLLYLAPASAPISSLFPKPILIGRMRPGGGREIVVNAIPFDSSCYDHIRTFAEKLDKSFLPRPQGAQPAIAVGNRHPEVSLPAAFEAFRTVYKTLGVNLASTSQLSATREMAVESAIATRDGEDPLAPGHTRVSIKHLYHAGLWAAIRAGWREGYNAEADHFIVSGSNPNEIDRSIAEAKEAIKEAAGYTKFTTDTSRLFELRADSRHPATWTDTEVEKKFEQLFRPDDKSWILEEFSKRLQTAAGTFEFSVNEIQRLAVKFGRSIQVNIELFDAIRRAKVSTGLNRTFDFEPSLDEADTLTTPAELFFYMHWLKSQGRPAQLVPPNLGFKKRQAYPETMDALVAYCEHKMWPELLPRVEREFGGDPIAELHARVKDLSALARHFNGTLSIHSGSGKQAQVLNLIGRATSGRVNYKISGELQLQLLDVLSEQPEGSEARALYDRMVARCNAFATAGAFGEESALAAKYSGSYLGDASKGRTDGNLFLVFWLGNVVGSKDADGRFFKQHLDELPAKIVKEVQSRNTKYIVWLASQLRG
jgi:hypothetical protein